MATMQIKALIDIPHSRTGKPAGHKAGDIIDVQCKDGIPLSRFWRDRLKDSAIDGCCEIVRKQKSTSKVGEK